MYDKKTLMKEKEVNKQNTVKSRKNRFKKHQNLKSNKREIYLSITLFPPTNKKQNNL